VIVSAFKKPAVHHLLSLPRSFWIDEKFWLKLISQKALKEGEGMSRRHHQGLCGLSATLLSVVLCAYSHPVTAQQASSSADLSSFTSIHGQYDQGVPTPQFVPVSGFRQDAGALAEINAFRSQVGVGVWQDLIGQGSIQFGNDQSVQGQAHIEILQPKQFRMDTVLDESGETTSLRRSGSREFVSRAGKAARSVDTRDAAAGIFIYPRLEEPTFPAATDLLIDDGSLTIDGQSYHRITLEYPPPSAGNVNHFSSWIVVDLYFDPASHLLEKSAGISRSIGSSAVSLRVLTYGDYQKSGAAIVPMQYRETLNGQIAWTLQLTQVALNSGISSQDFSF
jgi:hypothetical protein